MLEDIGIWPSLWSVYYIFESSDGENKRTPRGLLKALFYKPEGLELLDVAQCCYNLTTKKLCVELKPLRVGHGATASDAPHHCDRRGLAHQPTLFCFVKRWQERNDLAQTYLNNLKACPRLKEEESRPCRNCFSFSLSLLYRKRGW
jgi:hypothetical protein